MNDEQAIRDVIATWLRATAAGDTDQVLSLMTDDVVFLTPGQKPFGKEAFAAASRASKGKVQIEGNSDIEEIQVFGEIAHCLNRLSITLTPRDGEPRQLSGYTQSMFRKQPDGRWLLARDANFVAPEGKPRNIEMAVPVLRVASVAKSIVWYRDVLTFRSKPFGPPDDPAFAILEREGVELMLMKVSCDVGQPRSAGQSGGGWDVYIRVANAQAIREAVKARVPDMAPIVTKEYGCHEFELSDPDGHVLVIGQCG